LKVCYKGDSQGLVVDKGEEIQVLESPVADFIYEEDGYTHSFYNRSQGSYNWKWLKDGEEFSINENPSHIFNYNGEKQVKLIAYSLNGCYDMVEKSVKVKIVHPYYMPSAFTPNGNGIDDYFGPEGVGLQDYKFTMLVYDRMGQLVFETSNPEKKWDGKIKGTNKSAAPGVYTFKVVTIDKYGNKDRRIGSVTILDPSIE
ncbi:MAG: hypothetical protein C0594_06260, partial [Marinilabiliales bacterium]